MGKEAPDHGPQGIDFQQKGVMPVAGFDFAETDILLIFQQGFFMKIYSFR